MSGISAETLGRPEILVIFAWQDGPVEGIAKSGGGDACWYFKLLAERLETSTLDDRLFALWAIPEPDGSTLVEEFGGSGQGAHIWPVSGGLGSAGARGIVDGLLSARPGSPKLIIRTPDLVDVLGVWNVAPD